MLWKFDTSTRRWQRVENGAGPGARRSHVMVSVGLDLWMHGGITNSGEGDDVCGTHASSLLLLSRDRDCTTLYLVTDGCACCSVATVTVFAVVCYDTHDLYVLVQGTSSRTSFFCWIRPQLDERGTGQISKMLVSRRSLGFMTTMSSRSLTCSNDTSKKTYIFVYFILILLDTSRYQRMVTGQNRTPPTGTFPSALSLFCPAP